MSQNMPENDSQIIIYQTESGQTKIEVRLENETVWLTQKLMAELFQTSKQNVGQHLKNIFADGELKEGSVVKKFFTTAADGKQYSTAFYNLDTDYFCRLSRAVACRHPFSAVGNQAYPGIYCEGLFAG